jgi:hypothetical protein
MTRIKLEAITVSTAYLILASMYFSLMYYSRPLFTDSLPYFKWMFGVVAIYSILTGVYNRAQNTDKVTSLISAIIGFSFLTAVMYFLFTMNMGIHTVEVFMLFGCGSLFMYSLYVHIERFRSTGKVAIFEFLRKIFYLFFPSMLQRHLELEREYIKLQREIKMLSYEEYEPIKVRTKAIRQEVNIPSTHERAQARSTRSNYSQPEPEVHEEESNSTELTQKDVDSMLGFIASMQEEIEARLEGTVIDLEHPEHISEVETIEIAYNKAVSRYRELNQTTKEQWIWLFSTQYECVGNNEYDITRVIR